MRFGTTKSPSSPSKPPTTPDTGIFAVACTLQSHLHAIEQRFLSGQETNDSLKRRKNELTEVLRLFRIVEENEVASSNELEEEVEVAVRECGLGYEDAAEIRLDPGADVEGIMERSGRRMRVRPVDGWCLVSFVSSNALMHFYSPAQIKRTASLLPRMGNPGTFKPRVAIPPRWKKVIALSASVSSSRARTSGSSSAATTLLDTGSTSATTTLSGTGTLSDTSTLPSTGTPPLTLSTLSQTPDTASISSSTCSTGGLGLCGSLRTSKLSRSKPKFHTSKSKVKSTMSKKNFKMKRRGSDTTAKPYKTRRSRSRSASLRSPVLVVHYKTGTVTPGSSSSIAHSLGVGSSGGGAGSGSSGAGSSGAHVSRGGLGGLGGGGMWNATRVDNAGAGTGTGVEGEFRFVM